MRGRKFVVLARSDDGSGLFVTEGRQGLQTSDSAALDPTRRLADIEFTDSPATLIGSPTDGAASLDQALSIAQVAMAVEQVGAAQRCLDMAIEYTTSRSQFSRPIASFQAVKHACADMFVDVQSARSVALHAAWAFDADPIAFESASHLAAALVSDAFYRTAAQNIQLHGAIGFTWEHDAHLYLKRAISSARLLSTPEQHREATAKRWVCKSKANCLADRVGPRHHLADLAGVLGSHGVQVTTFQILHLSVRRFFVLGSNRIADGPELRQGALRNASFGRMPAVQVILRSAGESMLSRGFPELVASTSHSCRYRS